MAYQRLFSTVSVGRRSLKNRLVHPATVTGFAVAGQVSDQLIRYHQLRASGGLGMIVSEAMAVDATSVTQNSIVAAFDKKNDAGFRRWAEAVEHHDCRLIGQLFHLGRHHVVTPGLISLSATARPDPSSWAVPKKMSAAEIRGVRDSFVECASRLCTAGFSGVELHAAQGFLLEQFLSPLNNRNDRYGGQLENRLRLIVEIVDGIRSRLDRQFLIGLKISAEENLGTDGLDAVTVREIVARLAKGIDYFGFSHGGPGPSFDQHVPDMTFPTHPFRSYLRPLKKSAAGKPIMAMGRIVSADDMDLLVARGEADLIGLSRPIVADPMLPARLAEDQQSRIRPCIYCNVCWAQLPKNRSIICVTNPTVGTAEEGRQIRRHTGATKRVVVVGAGPAGLEAAAVSAELGHEVWLFEAAAEVGGLAGWQSRLPGRNDIASLLDYQLGRIRGRKVSLRLETTATPALIEALGATDVIVATGSEFSPLNCDTDGTSPRDIVVATKELLAGRQRVDGTAVVFDHDQREGMYAAIDLLARRYERVFILSPRTDIVTESAAISAVGIRRRLRLENVDYAPLSYPLSLVGTTMAYEYGVTGETRSIDNVSAVVYATLRVARSQLYDAMCGRIAHLQIAGDARAPRGLAAAVAEGRSAALRIG